MKKETLNRAWSREGPRRKPPHPSTVLVHQEQDDDPDRSNSEFQGTPTGRAAPALPNGNATTFLRQPQEEGFLQAQQQARPMEMQRLGR